MKRKQTIAEEVSSECIAVRLRMLHRAIARMYNDELRPLGLTISQMNILVAVSRLESPSQGAVCRALHLEKSTLSRDLTRMKKLGWIRETSGRDARLSVLGITTGGTQLLERAYPAWQRAQSRARELLGNNEIQAIGQAVRSLFKR